MNAKRRIIIAAVLVLLFCAGVFLRFGSPRIRIAGASDTFTKAQIKDALNLVDEHLTKSDAIRSVVDIRFNEEKSEERLDGWESGQQNGVTKENSIVVFTDFFTSTDSGAFNPNDLYTAFAFTLQMQEDGHWNMVEGGAGYP